MKKRRGVKIEDALGSLADHVQKQQEKLYPATEADVAAAKKYVVEKHSGVLEQRKAIALAEWRSKRGHELDRKLKKVYREYKAKRAAKNSGKTGVGPA